MRWSWPRRHAAVSTILCLLLSYLPEMLLHSGGPALAPPTASTRELTLRLDGMGCEACQLHVRTVLERSAGVVSSEVDFEKGLARVLIADDWGWNLTAVGERLSHDGYEILGSETVDSSPSSEHAASRSDQPNGPAASAASAASANHAMGADARMAAAAATAPDEAAGAGAKGEL